MSATIVRILSYIILSVIAGLILSTTSLAQSLVKTGDIIADAVPYEPQTLEELRDDETLDEEERKKKKKKLEDRSATLEIAERNFAKGNYKKALKYYDKILSWDTNDAYVNFRKGLAVYQMKSYEEARPYFERTILVDPNIYRAYSSLSASYILDGDTKSARRVLKRLQNWIKECGLMCFGDQAAYTAEEDIKDMLRWADLKNKEWLSSDEKN